MAATTDADHTTDAQMLEECVTLLERYYDEEIKQLASGYPSDTRSLYVDYSDVLRFDPDLARDLLDQPDQIREYLEAALQRYDLPVDIDLSRANVRIYDLPSSDVFDVADVARHQHIGRLMDIKGQVAKVSDVKPRLVEGAFECQRCGTMNRLNQEGSDARQEPHECQGCERQGPFQHHASKSEWTNHQYVRLQQPPERTTGGDGATVDVHLEDDLIARVEAGDRVTLTGELGIEQPDSDSRDYDTTVDAHSVIREESDYEDIDIESHREKIEEIAAGKHGDPYDLLVDSINPKHHGDETIKLAIALQLFGGWAHEYPDGSRDRGDWHVLLLGDPGCGKSTFLRYIDSIAPRSTYASGKGASAAGMTAAATSDDFGDTEWGLEAGALVLADKGIACVDEIDKMQDDAVKSMHNALESQKVRVNKAGINATLNARTSLLAAGNPADGRFDPYRPYGEQIDLGPTLLSRFDLMFMVSDEPDAQQDADVVEHMIESRRAAGRYTRGDDLEDDQAETVSPAIGRDLMRAYVAHAKRTCYPVIEEQDVQDRLTEFFVSFRNDASSGDEDDAPVPITYRQVEGLQRIAEASARVRLSDTIELQDVERAIKLVTTSMSQVGYDPESGEYDADIINTGQSRSQRDRRNAIVDICDEEGSVTLEELDEHLNADRSTIEHDVEQLKDKGRLYQPSDSGLRKV